MYRSILVPIRGGCGPEKRTGIDGSRIDSEHGAIRASDDREDGKHFKPAGTFG